MNAWTRLHSEHTRTCTDSSNFRSSFAMVDGSWHFNGVLNVCSVRRTLRMLPTYQVHRVSDRLDACVPRLWLSHREVEIVRWCRVSLYVMSCGDVYLLESLRQWNRREMLENETKRTHAIEYTSNNFPWNLRLRTVCHSGIVSKLTSLHSKPLRTEILLSTIRCSLSSSLLCTTIGSFRSILSKFETSTPD